MIASIVLLTLTAQIMAVLHVRCVLRELVLPPMPLHVIRVQDRTVTVRLVLVIFVFGLII